MAATVVGASFSVSRDALIPVSYLFRTLYRRQREEDVAPTRARTPHRPGVRLADLAARVRAVLS